MNAKRERRGSKIDFMEEEVVVSIELTSCRVNAEYSPRNTRG